MRPYKFPVTPEFMAAQPSHSAAIYGDTKFSVGSPFMET